MKKLLGLVLVALSGCSGAHFSAKSSPQLHLEGAGTLRYYVYAPKDWSADKAWPVVVYLHGAGERGTDPAAPAGQGVGYVAGTSGGTFPAVVVIPQAPDGTYWGMPGNNERVLRALDETMAKYHGDPARVYLTGNSLGGFGTWFLGALHPERFAALVPICGGVRGKAPSPDAPFAAVPENERAADIARRIGKVPVWIFHGKKDFLVPVAYSRELDDALKAAGGDVRYTEYADLGHVSWDRAYADPALWAWLLQQHK